MPDAPTAIACAVWWATPLPPVDSWLALLDTTELPRYQSFRQLDDRRRFLTGRVLIRSVVGKRLGVNAADVELTAVCPDCGKPHGRPRVVGADGLALSITHAGQRVGLAITDGAPVGIDVEQTTRRSDEMLARYALSDAEHAELQRLPEPERAAAFFTYWTRKEAVLKATGRGLRIGLRSIELSPPHAPPRLLTNTDDLDAASTALADLHPGSGYRGSVAVLNAHSVEVNEQWWTPS